MPRIKLKPDSVSQELADYQNKAVAIQEKLTTSCSAPASPGASDRERVFSIGNVGLFHYRALSPAQHPIPVLITYALVNRAEMADLQSDRSLIRSLLSLGLDVYLIDWDYPSGADRQRTLDDYLFRYIDGFVDFIRSQHELKKINLFGICQGGTFSACYAALCPQKVRNLITTVTPIDFHTKHDMLSHFFRGVDVDALVDSEGNISGDLMNYIFLSLKPFRLGQQKYVEMVHQADSREAIEMFKRMEYWIFDSPDLAGEAFRQFAKQFYQENLLIKAQAKIGDRRVNLANLTMPVLNIYASDDHLVPPAASKALGEYVGSEDYTELEFPGGHIGLYVSSKAHRLVPAAINDWLLSR